MGIQYADRGVAVLRIVVGFWYLYAGYRHLAWTPLPWTAPGWARIAPKIIAGDAQGHPIGFYKKFLEEIVVPNADLFVGLASLGEFLVGLSLTFGIASRLGALGGLFLALVYGLMTIGDISSQGFHLVLITSMVIFLVTGPGRLWGVDSILASLRPGARIW